MVKIYPNTVLTTVEALNTKIHTDVVTADPTHISVAYSIIRQNGALYGIVIDENVLACLTADEQNDIIEVDRDDPNWFPQPVEE